MEKIFITIIVLYALFIGIYFLWLKSRERWKKDIVGKGSSTQETRKPKASIVGKSRFDLREVKPLAANPEPLTASPPKTENPVENTDTFVPSDAEKLSVEVPPEELDEVFSETPPDEENKPMDINYPLEYETDEGDGEEPEEVEGAAQAALASGVPFDDLGNAVRTVNQSDEASPEQKRKAGDTLLEIRKTDMFEQVVSGKPDAKRIVTNLMAESFAAFYERKDRGAGTSDSGKKAPDSFSIRDFV